MRKDPRTGNDVGDERPRAKRRIASAPTEPHNAVNYNNSEYDVPTSTTTLAVPLDSDVSLEALFGNEEGFNPAVDDARSDVTECNSDAPTPIDLIVAMPEEENDKSVMGHMSTTQLVYDDDDLDFW